MSVFSSAFGVGYDAMVRLHGTTSGTYAQSSNTQTLSAIRRGAARPFDPGMGLDEVEEVFLFDAADFTSGFSSSNPVTPGPRDLFTISGEDVWEVQNVELLAEGTYYRMTASKRSMRGQA